MGHPRRFGHLLVMSGLRVTSEVAVIRSPRGEAGASGNALTHGHVIDELRICARPPRFVAELHHVIL